MELAKDLDTWRFEQRKRDALQHSVQLSRDFPVQLVKPFSGTNLKRFHRELDQKHASRKSFRQLLEQLDRDEYGDPTESSKVLSSGDATPDPLQAFRKVHRDLNRRLQKTLSAHSYSSRTMAGKSDRRSQVGENAKRYGRMDRLSGPYDGNAQYAFKNQDEINQIEELLEKYRISRAAEDLDNLFYTRLAEREKNVVVEEVVSELLLELCVETYEDAERAARGKELPPEQLQVVQDALHSGPTNRVLIEKYNVNITRGHLQCLLPMQWLNDEVINFWFQLLNDRDVELVQSGTMSKRSHFFNSFFYTKVSENGYNFVNVRRWTRKIDIFALDKVFVPVNLSNTHWCLAVIFMQEKRIQYYDSMDGGGMKCLSILLRYLHDEMQHKKKSEFDGSEWKLVPSTPETPQQHNGSDCGVFTCIFADYISRNQPLDFSQRDMAYHRHRMVLHIVEGCLPTNEDI